MISVYLLDTLKKVKNDVYIYKDYIFIKLKLKKITIFKKRKQIS